MSKRITITHDDDIKPADAILAVKVCVFENIQPGEVCTMTNGLAVESSRKAKFPSFYVWRSR